MGVLESQLSAKFSPISQLSVKILAISQLTVDFNRSQLIFFPQCYVNVFFIQKVSNTLTSSSIRRSEAFAAT